MILIYNFTPGWTAVRFGKKKPNYTSLNLTWFIQNYIKNGFLFQHYFWPVRESNPGRCNHNAKYSPLYELVRHHKPSPNSSICNSPLNVTHFYILIFCICIFTTISHRIEIKKNTRRKVKNRKQIFQRKPQDKLIEISKHSRKKKQQPPNQNNCQFTGMRIFALPSEPNILAYVFRAHL